MNILIQFALFTLNLAIGMMNYELGNYGVAMFNTTVAGLCLGFFISARIFSTHYSSYSQNLILIGNHQIIFIEFFYAFV